MQAEARMLVVWKHPSQPEVESLFGWAVRSPFSEVESVRMGIHWQQSLGTDCGRARVPLRKRFSDFILEIAL